MLVISTREFRDKQRKYLDLVDNKEQVIVQRGKNKAYTLSPITETDRYFSDPEIKKRLLKSIKQAKQGELTTLPKEDIDKYLGL
jgi:PHD/YefM family antitoxin component YafN of YafNO toxin-antitoxin module